PKDLVSKAALSRITSRSHTRLLSRRDAPETLCLRGICVSPSRWCIAARRAPAVRSGVPHRPVLQWVRGRLACVPVRSSPRPLDLGEHPMATHKTPESVHEYLRIAHAFMAGSRFAPGSTVFVVASTQAPLYRVQG